MKNLSLVLIFIFSFITQNIHAIQCNHHQTENEKTESHEHSVDHDHDHDHESAVAFLSNSADENSHQASDHCRFHCCSNHFVMISQNNRFQNDAEQTQFATQNDTKQIHFHSSLYRPPIV